MTPDERTLLSDLFRHLREVENQPRDAEAEAFIHQSVQSQPLSAYYMAQTVLVQQQALTAAQARIEELERQASEARSRAGQPAAPSGGGSFLSNALGLRSPWASRGGEPLPSPAPRAGGYAQPGPAQPARSPWGGPAPQQPTSYAPPPGAFGQPGYAPQQGYAPQRGGGFLAGAAQTAAGVAGGMLAASAISSLLSHSPGPFGEAAASTASAPAGETVINNFYGDAAPQTQDVSHQQDAPYQEADYQSDDASFDDGGGDGGGDDSWV